METFMFDCITIGMSFLVFIVQAALVFGGVYFIGKLLIDYALKQWKK